MKHSLSNRGPQVGELLVKDPQVEELQVGELLAKDPQVEELLEGLESSLFDAPAVSGQPRIFGPDDPTPEYHLDNPISDELVVQASFEAVAQNVERISSATSDSSPRLNTRGSTVSDVSEFTTASLAAEQSAGQAASGSFLVVFWLSFILVVILIALGATQFFKRVRGNFKNNNVPTGRPSETDSRLTGQFKVSTRYQKPKLSAGSVTDAAAMHSIDTPTNGGRRLGGFKSTGQQVDLGEDRPADDEFDLGFDGGVSDSDGELFSREEAAMILEAAEIRAVLPEQDASGVGSRFK